MPIVLACSASEEAYLAAATLESVGIEATIVDHSSFDSSLLGATAGVDTMAIEVSEDDVERAVELLAPKAPDPARSEAEAGDPEREHTLDLVTSEPPRLRELFRTLVVMEVVVIAISIVFSDLLYHKTPSDFDLFIVSQVPSEGLWAVADRVANGFILMCLLASVLIFQFMHLGRILYLANTAWWLITYVAYPPALRTPLGELINLLEWALAGALITLMWLPPLSNQFRRRPSES